MRNLIPEAQGLYVPSQEHDACGVGMILNIYGQKSHEIVENGLSILENMTHRGAEGADSKTGDGAGIMVQIPHEFILLQGIAVPEKGRYGTGLVFLPKDNDEANACMALLEATIKEASLTLLAVRDVPVCSEILGIDSGKNEPQIKQIFVSGSVAPEELELALYILRKKVERAALELDITQRRSFYIVSLSTQRMIYKGMLSSTQVRPYFPDLSHPNFTSGIALVHSRFSTNTFPTWDLAQPFRLIGHNGEINTIRGNRLWMEARETVLKSDRLGAIAELWPVVQPAMSDSASLDNVLEFLVMSGMSLPHALSMLIPESWNSKNPISTELKAFYEYHSVLMEPWDGPATILFTDGRYAGGLLDRNGLRPARYTLTTDGMMIIASETGVLPIAPERIKEKGRLKPGKMLMVDTATGTICYDPELKEELAGAFPYKAWLEKNRLFLDKISSGRSVKYTVADYEKLLHTYGYFKEDIQRSIIPMAAEGKEPISSMGNDAPVAVLSHKPQRLFNYFRQLFAQVTNPPIDPIREELVMSLSSYIGSIHTNMLEPMPEHCKMIKLNSPIITNVEFDLMVNLKYKGFSCRTLPMVFKYDEQSNSLQDALDALCADAEAAVDEGVNFIVLSDRGIDAAHAPIPSLLAVAAVHHHLISTRKRVQTAIVVETAEPREVMHFALLAGFGANAINPYLAFAVIDNVVKNREIQLDYATAEKNYIKSVNKGLLKVFSKMGISTLRSYCGAQIFEAVGIGSSVLDKYFKGIASKIEGVEIVDIAHEACIPHYEAFAQGESNSADTFQGVFAWRKDGEFHAWNPETISTLQLATRLGSYKKFKEYTASVDHKTEKSFIRDFLTFESNPISIDEVESVESITKRFCTGAMSYGSISREAHEAMAIAMNAIGGKSNTGEGGEDPERFHAKEDGSSARSAIKQVASGRFGVTTEYLVNADEIQIKVAQGAKPGEGGQLPGYKVDKIIAKTRHSIPGISLISPPPHHDIYSIEDLAQLIYDLKNVNPRARISVKLVSESGVGTIAAGVAKAKADMILISGCEGGTGASPSSSIKHAGLPLEIGLAETQQTLVLNNLRGVVRLQADGQLKTGRDIIVAALLGAEEYGFSTSALIVLGCVMMRKCHLNTCPVGVATQDEELRRRFVGRSEYLINFFRYLAQEVREYLAEMGFRSLDEIVGRSELLCVKDEKREGKQAKLDFSRMIYRPDVPADYAIRNVKAQHHAIDEVRDRELIALSASVVAGEVDKVEISREICNTDRSVGAMLSGVIASKYGNDGLAEDSIVCRFNGSAGQSFGAFLSKGVTFCLEGDANDYLGKGLAGGKITVVPSHQSTFAAEKNIIAGNTLLYGATSGRVFISGQAGERFCVRNSGAIAVVEGAGDHCCEYMTGGKVVVLGRTGRNFAAGMSGGVAYVYNPDGDFDYFCNMEMVELSLIEDYSDNRELKSLVEEHYYATNSKLANRLLQNWHEEVQYFIKVTPIEYKKVIEEEKIAAISKKIAQVEYDY